MTDRTCTECHKSVEDAPYSLWLFHTCKSCAIDAQNMPVRHDRKIAETGTYRKWRYYPKWHMVKA